MKRVLVAGTGSGCGKTSVACGLMRALIRRGLRVSACKCGPDYIDPMFHREVVGAPSRNLDLFLCGEAAVKALLAESCGAADITVIEGVMGFYDGLGGGEEASSHHLAGVTQTPVLLVLDARGRALSLAAEAQGFRNFRENRIGGVLLNRCTERSYPLLKELVETHGQVPVLGYLPSLPEAAVESRHLGLVTASEVENLRAKIDRIAETMERTVDLDGVLALAGEAPPLETVPRQPPAGKETIRVAVARDEAFCFVYEDNLRLLQSMGAEILEFSPLVDSGPPEDIHGLMLSGGYPELHAEALSRNRSMRSRIRELVLGGLPTIAECGGLLYLSRSVGDGEGREFPMAGVVDTATAMTKRLSRFGYITLTARENNLLCRAGETLRAHEFHYSEAEDPGRGFRAEKQRGAAWDTGHVSPTLYAGYPHLHFWGNEGAAVRFLERCRAYKLNAEQEVSG